jgi:NAD(P)-dependent dehydrogenase (short-subunit alcohol dehydrogenase family)
MSKVVLITGASSGLGKALATQLHEQGDTVYGTSRSDRNDFPYTMLKVDVLDEQSIHDAIAHIQQVHQHLDLLINNAGIGMAAPVEHLKVESAEAVFDTNVMGMLRVTRKALPLIRLSKKGRIINISSIGAVVGLPFRGVYCASKASVDLITESLRFELKPLGIQVCSVRAGDIQTNVNETRIKEYDAHDMAYKDRFERTYKSIEEDVINGMPVEEVARQIIKISTKKKLRPYYNIGKFTQRLGIIVKRLTPSSFYEWALSQYLN